MIKNKKKKKKKKSTLFFFNQAHPAIDQIAYLDA
jgi:hypothetical protein